MAVTFEEQRTQTKIEASDRTQQVLAALCWPVLAACAAFLILRFQGLPFWHDEFDSLYFARIADPALFWSVIGADVHPPLHPMLAQASYMLGLDAPELRLTNLLALALMAALVLTRAGSERDKALMAVVLLFPGFAFYLLDFRPYAMIYAHGACLALLTRQEAEERPARLAHVWWIALAALSLLHYFSMAAFGAAFAVTAAARLRDGRDLRPLLPSAIVFAGLSAAWLAYSYPLIGGKTGGNFWISWWDLLMVRDLSPNLLSDLSIALLALGVLVSGTWLRAPFWWRFAPGAIALAGVVVISLHTPIITPRNLMAFMPFFVVAALTPGGPAVWERVRSGFVLATVAIAAAGAFSARPTERHDVKGGAAIIADLMKGVPAHCPIHIPAGSMEPIEIITFATYLPDVDAKRLTGAEKAHMPPATPGCPRIGWTIHWQSYLPDLQERIAAGRADGLLVFYPEGNLIAYAPAEPAAKASAYEVLTR